MLKPCPRCGSDNISVTYHLYECSTPCGTMFPEHNTVILVMIHCKDCGAAITKVNEKEAHDYWNSLSR